MNGASRGRALGLRLALAFGALLGCGRSPEVPPSASVDEPPASVLATPELQGLEPRRWVSIYDPQRAWGGYTLAFYNARIPILIDMNGRIVHAWGKARAKSRLQLLEDGSLLAISLKKAVVEYDWDGNLVWEYPIVGGFAHHDVVRLDNGNTLFPVLRSGERSDDILEVDREGQVVWEWRSRDHLGHLFDERDAGRVNMTHINSVQVLPENPWFEAGDERFRPGNVLLSARTLNAVFIIDRRSGEAVWQYDTELDLQHEAKMKGPGLPAAGNILIYNNGYRNRYRYRQTTILEIEPRSGVVVWDYSSNAFYSPTSGIEQALPNGNVLITSSRGGRAFEVNRRGDIVWEWTPPFEPTRPRRYAYDHTPQLAALGRPVEERVPPAEGYGFVDRDVYRFALRRDRRSLEIDGSRVSILRDNNHCQEIVLPAGASLALTYGFNAAHLQSAGRDAYAATFGLDLRPIGGGAAIEVLRDRLEFDNLDAETAPVRSRTVDLGPYAFQRVELCVVTVAADGSDEPTEGLAYWHNPVITSAADLAAAGVEAPPADLSPEELEVRREHLRALGYVN